MIRGGELASPLHENLNQFLGPSAVCDFERSVILVSIKQLHLAVLLVGPPSANLKPGLRLETALQGLQIDEIGGIRLGPLEVKTALRLDRSVKVGGRDLSPDRLPEDVEPMTVLEGGLRAYLGTLGDGVWVLRKQPARVEDVNVMTGKAYPNPATEFVTIELGEQMQGTAKVTIVNTLGATELFVSTSIEGDKITIDVQDLPSGSYEYTIETNTKLIRGKLTIQR